jgi:hypothetical protein
MIVNAKAFAIIAIVLWLANSPTVSGAPHSAGLDLANIDTPSREPGGSSSFCHETGVVS